MSLKQNWATGDSFGATDLNSIAGAVNALGFNAQTAYVATAETTTSTTYTDLTTTTDSVTVTIGSSGMALVLLSSYLQNNTSQGEAFMGFALSGANTVAANDNQAIMLQSFTANAECLLGAPFLLTGLVAGSTTFKAKYKQTAGTGNFKYRRISVIPFP